MTIDVLTGFPEILDGPVNSSIIRNALLNNAVEIWVHNLRHYTADRHGKIDDTPYGGGAGMVLMAQPIWSCLDHLKALRPRNPALIFMTPQGLPLTQEKVRDLSMQDWVIILCGHYKDIDARVFERDTWLELSCGDFVVSGGELPAAMLVDAVVRCLPGVIGNSESAATDSFESGLLDAPYFTKPEEVSGYRVPDVMISGNHRQIAEWRNQERERRTKERRPDLWQRFIENKKDKQ